MRRLLAALAAALVLPGAAQAKAIDGLVVCGPEACEQVALPGFGHADPIGAAAEAPPPSAFLRLDFTFDGHPAGYGVFYEPRSGLVAVEPRPGRVQWAQLAPRAATAAKRAATGLQPFPAQRVTGVRIGDRRVAGDPAPFLPLLDATGPFAMPATPRDAERIRFETSAPGPWFRAELLYYAEDGLLNRNGTFLELPAGLAAALGAAEEEAGGAAVPWLPIGVALAGATFLLALFLRARTGRNPALAAT